MREIKFRAWEKSKKKMTYFSLADLLDGYGDELVDVSIPSNEYFTEYMQYTGLKDKNSVDIYEGDCVKSLYELDGYECFHIGIITYDSLNCCFYSHSIKSEISRSLSGINKSIEIIGNIHENQELIS